MLRGNPTDQTMVKNITVLQAIIRWKLRSKRELCVITKGAAKMILGKVMGYELVHYMLSSIQLKLAFHFFKL